MEMPMVGTMMAKGTSRVGFLASPEKLMTYWAPPAAKERYAEAMSTPEMPLVIKSGGSK